MEWNNFLVSNCKGNEGYLNLYMHNGKKYFTFVDCRNRGVYRYANITLGRVGFYKGYINEDKKGNIIDWKSPETYLYSFSGNLNDVPSHYRTANKLTISEIVNETKKIENMQSPNYIANMDKCFWILPCMLYAIAIENTYCFGASDEMLQKCSIHDFVKNTDKYYGDKMVKLCYLNPFDFEEKYPEIVSKNKKGLKEMITHFWK